jgi:hypothetical protein
MPVKLPPSNRLDGSGTGLETWLRILLVHLRQWERLPRSPLLHKASKGAKMCHGAEEKGNPLQNSIRTVNRRSQTNRCREAATTWLRCRRDRSHAGFACEDIATKPAEFGHERCIDQHHFTEAVTTREAPEKKKARNRGGSGLFVPVAKKAIRRRLRQLWSALRSSPLRLP